MLYLRCQVALFSLCCRPLLSMRSSYKRDLCSVWEHFFTFTFLKKQTTINVYTMLYLLCQVTIFILCCRHLIFQEMSLQAFLFSQYIYIPSEVTTSTIQEKYLQAFLFSQCIYNPSEVATSTIAVIIHQVCSPKHRRRRYKRVLFYSVVYVFYCKHSDSKG